MHPLVIKGNHNDAKAKCYPIIMIYSNISKPYYVSSFVYNFCMFLVKILNLQQLFYWIKK